MFESNVLAVIPELNWLFATCCVVPLKVLRSCVSC